MRQFASGIVYILFIVLCVTPSRVETREYLDERDIQHIGSTFSNWFYTSQLDTLIDCFANPDYTLAQLAEFRSQIAVQLGSEQEVLSEYVGTEPWQYYYIRNSRFEHIDQPVRTLFAFTDKINIVAYSVLILPHEAETPFAEYQVKTKLSLPFKGEWYVAWGGRTIQDNQHAVSSEQRFACDFYIKKDGRTFETDGFANTDYYCFNKDIIAPASGRIVEVLNDIADNTPGQSPEIHGNRLVIAHGNSEYSILAHFKQGSIVVKKGDTVNTGQLLGLCGNSGHSSEPHLHYHLQNTPDIDHGEGLPLQFQSYLSDGKFVTRGEPKIGDTVQNATQK